MSISANFPNVRPSLLLDFAQSQQLDSRVTFSRSTTAPYYDGKTSALAEQNLLTYSQTFSNAAWTKQNATITDNFSIAPDGTTTASKLTANTSAARIYQGGTTGNVQATASIWIKRRTGTGNVNWEIVGVGVGPLITVTSSWQQVTYTATVLAGGIFYFGLRMDTAGDEIDIWGAQLEQRSSVTAYNATTTSAITNYIPQLLTAPINAPRFDFNPTTGESLGLLIEEQRTNLLLQSENVTSSPWGAGVSGTSTRVQSGWNAGFNIAQITATSANGGLRQTISGLTSGQVYTLSFYLQSTLTSVIVRGENSLSTYGASLIADINPTTGAIGTNAGFVITSAPLGNGRVYKCVLPAAGGSLFLNIEWISATTNIPFYLGAFQLEAGAFATSYIPTTSAQVTRASDNASMTGTNFSSWYNQAEGTLYAEASTVSNGNACVYGIGDSTSNIIRMFKQNGNQAVYQVVKDATFSANLGMATTWTSGYGKIASVYKTDDFATSYNGGTSVTDTSGAVPIVNTVLTIGIGAGVASLNGYIKKIAYYPIRVTNTQLQALTGS